MKPRSPPYLAFELDALPKSDLAAMSVGLDEGASARALLRIWEYAWREQVEWVRPEVVLGCCKGNERLAGALTAAAYGFLEAVPAGWTSEPCTPEPIPVAGYRVRGARRYLRIGSPQSKGGHAAKGNLIPGGPRRRQSAEPDGGPAGAETSADARLTLGCGSAGTSADPGLQRASNSEHRESQLQHLAGAVAPADVGQGERAQPAVAPAVQPPPSTPSQTPTPPAKDAQEPAQALLEGVTVPATDSINALQGEWNSYTRLPRWRETGKERRKRAQLRLGERPMDGPHGWREVIRRIAESDFCCGEVPGRNGAPPWRATPDWLVANGENAVKVLEGKYDNQGGPRQTAPSCEVCGDPCKFQEAGHDLCEACRYLRFGEVTRSWKAGDPAPTAESERVAVAEWIEREREARRGEQRA